LTNLSIKGRNILSPTFSTCIYASHSFHISNFEIILKLRLNGCAARRFPFLTSRAAHRLFQA
jgi:hypothetical protein